jgi:branched-chain amino acid transport system ATP-binding protein
MLRVEGLDSGYDNVPVLNNININVENGELVAVVGSNGAGKSTLLLSIAGAVRCLRGKLILDGLNITSLSVPKRALLGLRLVREGAGFFPGMDVGENLELAIKKASIEDPRSKSSLSIEDVYGIFPILKERRKQLAHTLSGGERRMLGLARGFLSKPKLLMIDEPSLGLAPIVTQSIFRMIKQIKERGFTILLVEQNVKLALDVADRAIIIEHGRVVREGTGREMLSSESVQRAYLGI